MRRFTHLCVLSLALMVYVAALTGCMSERTPPLPQPASAPAAETGDKLVRVRAYLKRHKLDGVVFSSRANWAWLTAGGDAHIVSQSDEAFGALVVTQGTAYLVANRIEMPRFLKEEPVAGFAPKEFPWTTSLATALAELAGSQTWVSDLPGMTGLPAMPGDFAAECRASMLAAEIQRYKALGREASQVMESVALALQPGDSEQLAEANMARYLLERGIQPHVLLVAFDERIANFRHPAPTANRLKHHAMLVMCAQRHGQIVSLTRFVHFGPLPKDLAQRHEAVCRIEAAFWEATVPGTSFGAAFAAGQEQYRKEGFAQEWQLHHQGGPTGYSGRDYVAIPGEPRLVQPGQAVAWNPSLTGTKSEDTFVIEGDAKTGWVKSVVTAASATWPTVTITTPAGNQVQRPAILVR